MSRYSQTLTLVGDCFYSGHSGSSFHRGKWGADDVVVKLVLKDCRKTRSLVAHADITRDSDYLVRVIDVIDYDEASMALVLEPCITLSDVDTASEDCNFVRLVSDTLAALEALHSRGYSHRQVDLRHILYSSKDGRWKLTDLSRCKRLNSDSIDTSTTSAFSPSSRSALVPSSVATDVRLLAWTLYHLLMPAISLPSIPTRSKTGPPVAQLSPSAPADLRRVLEDLCSGGQAIKSPSTPHSLTVREEEDLWPTTVRRRSCATFQAVEDCSVNLSASLAVFASPPQISAPPCTPGVKLKECDLDASSLFRIPYACGLEGRSAKGMGVEVDVKDNGYIVIEGKEGMIAILGVHAEVDSRVCLLSELPLCYRDQVVSAANLLDSMRWQLEPEVKIEHTDMRATCYMHSASLGSRLFGVDFSAGPLRRVRIEWNTAVIECSEGTSARVSLQSLDILQKVQGRSQTETAAFARVIDIWPQIIDWRKECADILQAQVVNRISAAGG